MNHDPQSESAPQVSPIDKLRHEMNGSGAYPSDDELRILVEPPAVPALPLTTDADWNVRAQHRPADFTAEGWTLAVYGQHRDGCAAGPLASKRHSACNCGLSQAIERLNGAAVHALPLTENADKDRSLRLSGHGHSAGPVASAQQWRPIATAPKDGSFFIALTQATTVYKAHWCEQYRPAAWADAMGFFVYPTHWMPLPSPPQLQANGTADDSRPEVPEQTGKTPPHFVPALPQEPREVALAALREIAALDHVRDGERPPMVVALERWKQCTDIAKEAVAQLTAVSSVLTRHENQEDDHCLPVSDGDGSTNQPPERKGQ